MKISLNWLTDYLDITLSARELGELFTGIGLNCDGIDQTDSDVVFDLDVTSNRPDWLGHLGVARELAAAVGTPLRGPQVGGRPASGPGAAELTSVQVLEPALCPRYTARIIRGVKVGPSPRWMVERLAAVGLRSINNVVDVTNYILMEYSQPLHSFDFDRLDQRRIIVRRAKDGEQLVAIDGSKCSLTSQMLIIADASRPVAVAGIMGGLSTEVTQATTNVLIESAVFDAMSVRRTSRKLALMSDSNYRFERGIDPVATDAASLRACEMIVEVAGGELAPGLVDVWAKPWQPQTVSLRPQRTAAILGMAVPLGRQQEILAALGLSPRIDGGLIVCTIPSHRADLTREIDLIEEIARLHGYDKIPLAQAVTHAVRPEALSQRTRRRVGEVLTAAGFDEAITPTFVDAAEEALLGNAAPVTVQEVVRKSNNALRSSLAPSLLRAAKTNQDAGNADVSLFEVAAVFPPGAGGGLPSEFTQIGLATTRSLRELRGALECLAQRIAQASLEVVAQPSPGLADDIAGSVLVDGRPCGVIGQASAAVLAHYGLERPVNIATLRFDALLAGAGRTRTSRPLPKFPSVTRDLSLVVDEQVTWRQLADAIAAIDQPMRAGLQYVTTYRGKPIEPGRKSVTITLTYRWEHGTLRGEQVDEQVAAVVAALGQSLKAELRK